MNNFLFFCEVVGGPLKSARAVISEHERQKRLNGTINAFHSKLRRFIYLSPIKDILLRLVYWLYIGSFYSWFLMLSLFLFFFFFFIEYIIPRFFLIFIISVSTSSFLSSHSSSSQLLASSVTMFVAVTIMEDLVHIVVGIFCCGMMMSSRRDRIIPTCRCQWWYRGSRHVLSTTIVYFIAIIINIINNIVFIIQTKIVNKIPPS